MPTPSDWQAVRRRVVREQGFLALLVVAYLLAGRLGLTFAFMHPAVTPVWPPAGLALGALLVFGYRVWPAVFAGALILYATTLGLAPAVLAMAGGNTLEALLAAYLINRFAGGRSAMQNPVNCLRFAGLVTVVGTGVGATVGTTALAVSGLAAWSDYGAIWITACLGNITGALLVAPVLMIGLRGATLRWRTAQVVEGAGVLWAVLLISLVVFWGIPPQARVYPFEFLCVPVLLWGAFRLGRRFTLAALFILEVAALLGTLSGYGPFLRATPTASLALVQVFMALTAAMTLSLAALASEYLAATGQLRDLAVTDPLTGLPNYRRLLDVLGAEIARAGRSSQPLAVVFFDMDDLKNINDELGHLVGSRAVCRFAETLQAACRTTDTAARYGGDEFVAVLPETGEEGATAVVQRVAEQLAEDPDHPALAVSAGIAVYPRDGSTPTTLLSAADRALYAVKADKGRASRRNLVTVRELGHAG